MSRTQLQCRSVQLPWQRLVEKFLEQAKCRREHSWLGYFTGEIGVEKDLGARDLRCDGRLKGDTRTHTEPERDGPSAGLFACKAFSRSSDEKRPERWDDEDAWRQPEAAVQSGREPHTALRLSVIEIE
jgi:hypothetical protein